MPSASCARELRRIRAAAAVLRAEDARKSPAGYIPQAPTTKQAEFLSLDCIEALYGGAAAGGKSSALLMAALQYAHIPGYAALLLRRTFRDLNQPDAIMARSHEWLRGTGAVWNDRDKRWTFPSGATLTFGYLDNERDKFQYAGAALQFIGWDELTTFPEGWYRWLFSRLRKLTGYPVPLRVRGATNPGGIGHEWVKRRFLDDPTPERPFVSARLDDNPHIDADAYRESLSKLDATTRKQLEEGDWIRESGGLVYQYDAGRNVILEPPKCQVHLLGLDFGVVDENGIAVLGWRDNDPTVYVIEAYRFKGGVTEMAEEVQRVERKYHFDKIVGDVGGLGKAFAEEARKRFSIPIEPAEKTNKRGYIALFNDALGEGRIKLAKASTEALRAEWNELPWTEDRAKEVEGFDNHASDAALYAWRAASAYHEAPPPPPPTRAQVILETEERMIQQLEESVERSQDANWWES